MVRMMFFLLAFLAVLERPALAYVDPGAGSMVLQVFLAAIVGALFQFRRVVSFFRSKRQEREQ